MKIPASDPLAYIAQLPAERKPAMMQLRSLLNEHLPEGFEETMQYDMISYVVPYSLYPGGYHCDSKLPLPFISIASQKNFIALYHMGIYANPELLDWFLKQYPLYSKTKPDMGKSCIRFKKPDTIPFQLIAELATKMTPQDWIRLYELKIRK